MAKAKPSGKKAIGNVKWRSLNHRGPQFYPPYKSLGKQLFKYKKKIRKLSKGSEEVALMYAQYLRRRNLSKKLEKRLQTNFFQVNNFQLKCACYFQFKMSRMS